MADFVISKREKLYHPHEFIIKWLVDILMVVCISFIMSLYLFGKTVVVGHSMAPTLENSDGVLIDKISYCFGEPERFDVIVFEPEVANVSKYYIKRIIGLPGETVQIIDGLVYINGEVLKESWSEEIIFNAGLASEPITLGYDEYFVLGDNRNNSEDSRFANVGNVKYDSILGKIWAVSSPIGRMKIVK